MHQFLREFIDSRFIPVHHTVLKYYAINVFSLPKKKTTNESHTKMSEDKDDNNSSKNLKIFELEEEERKLVQGLESITEKLASEQGKQSTPQQVACSACPQEKLTYEICMQKWMNNEFFKGKSNNELPCVKEYEIYQKCVQVCLLCVQLCVQLCVLLCVLLCVFFEISVKL